MEHETAGAKVCRSTKLISGSKQLVSNTVNTIQWVCIDSAIMQRSRDEESAGMLDTVEVGVFQTEKKMPIGSNQSQQVLNYEVSWPLTNISMSQTMGRGCRGREGGLGGM